MTPILITPAAPRTAALRWVRTTAALAGAGLRPGSSRRAAVCAAARLLTALDTRVRVHPPPVAWPRVRPGTPGVLVVADSGSELAHLALVTAVPGSVAVATGSRGRLAGALRLPTVPATADAIAAALRAGTTVTVRPDRTGRHPAAGFSAAADVGAPVCPVAVRTRPGAGATGIDLHLLPEVAGAAGDAGALEDRARRALAAVSSR